jgi:formylglycine-generating enzyme required for sulfatase activity/type 1 glutamine amidotransferase
MDDVMLYDRALSAEEVKSLFESQGGKLAPTAAAPSPPQPAAAAPPADDGFQSLFNGRDLAGWVPMKSSGANDNQHEPATGGWIAQNGELVCATDRPGWLKSERQYGNFVLQLEFKLRPGGNSGVYIRSPDSGRLSRAGIEIQVIDEKLLPQGRAPDPSQMSGAICTVTGPSQPSLRPMGEWNLMEIRCDGEDIEVTLNGTRTAAANMSATPQLRDRPRSGYIGLANWRGLANGMSFRNIRIKELGAPSASAAPPTPPPSTTAIQPANGFQPLFNGRDLAGWVPMASSGRDDTEHQPTTGGWNVRDGELVCATNQTGWLKTERQYGDYVLRLEFKLLRDCNSDVYIRCPTSGHIARAGMAIQVIDPNYRGKQMPPDKLTGAIYGVVGSPQPPVRPPGEWNSMEIRCEGDTVEVTLNGTRTALANMSQNPVLQNRPRSGYIGVGNWHGEASGMSFRNIRIKELGAAAASAGKTKLLDMGNGVKMELIAIPPGEFLLGSTPEERQWAKAEAAKEREGDQPRRISMKNGFWLGRTEVTVGQWKRFVAATDYKTDAEKNSYVDFVVPKGGTWGRGNGLSWRDPGHGTPPRDDHPVCAVSWNDAMAFCRWLTEQERSAGRLPASHVVRLPTEAEWEYACRAGTQTRFWWGDATEDGQGRLNGTGEGDGFHFVAPVDHYGPRGRNAFGLADMLGNAYEWCLDDCDARQANEDCYKGNPAAKVLRGGSFNRSYEQLRCAARISNARTHSSYSDGFRVCLGQDMIDSAAAASTPAHAAAAGQNTINLLPLVDPQKDAVKGDWKLTSDGLVLEQPTGHTALDLPYAPPEEYDFEIEFTPTGKGMNVNQFLFAGGRSFAWKVARKEEYAVIELLDGKYYDQRKEGVSEKTLALEAGRRYISKVEVRRGSFRTLVNGEEFLRWSGDFNRLSLEPVFKLHDDRHIGVGSVRRGVIFHRIEVREVTGKGTFARGAPAAAASTTPALQHSNLPADLAAFCAEVAALPPVQQVARVVAKLKELNPNFDGKQTHKLEAGAVTELAVSTVGLRNLAPVSALKQLKKLTIAPWAANQKGALSDLSPLRELPLAWLYCQNNPITDLSPLKGLPLTVLGCGGTQVTELSPLAGMKLTVLSINDTAVNDLSPLSGAPLTVLWCNNTKVADFSPLGSSPLQELRCDYQPQRDAGALRGIPTLRKLNDQPAAVLLKQAPAATAGGDIRVLIVTGVDLPSHDWRATGPAIRNELQKDPRMKVEILNDIYRLDSTDLSKFQAVLLNFYTRGKPDPNEQARENLKNFVNRGGGLIVFHSTCGSFRDWPEFRDLAGKVMDTQKSYDKQGPMRVKIASANHPITRGMQPYETNDELYAFLSGRKAVQVLATARARSTGSDEPMAFVFDYGKGRVFHFVLGHDVRAIQTEGTAELLRRGAAWVAGREPATTTKR